MSHRRSATAQQLRQDFERRKSKRQSFTAVNPLAILDDANTLKFDDFPDEMPPPTPFSPDAQEIFQFFGSDADDTVRRFLGPTKPLPSPLENTDVAKSLSSSSSMQNLNLEEESDPTESETLDTYEENGKTIVVAGTLNDLIRILCSGRMDIDYTQRFLLTHRLFTSKTELITELTKLYKEFETAISPHFRQLFVLNVFRHWIKLLPEEFAGGSSAGKKLTEFLKSPPCQRDSQKKYADSILERIESASAIPSAASTESLGSTASGGDDSSTAQYVSSPVVSSPVVSSPVVSSPVSKEIKLKRRMTLTFQEMAAHAKTLKTKTKKPQNASEGHTYLGLDPEEFVSQLTLYEHRMIRRISLNEYFKHIQGDDPDHNMEEMILWSVKVSHWVATEVLSAASIRSRLLVIQRFLLFARVCESQNNFNGLFEIVTGLSMAPIQRLLKTWKSLPAKYVLIWQDLNRQVSPSDNFATYRKLLADCAGPMVPCLGMCLADLSWENEAQSKLEDGRINFFKYNALGSVFQTIMGVQQREPYVIAENAQQQQWFQKGMVVMEAEELENLSLKYESEEK